MTVIIMKKEILETKVQCLNFILILNLYEVQQNPIYSEVEAQSQDQRRLLAGGPWSGAAL